MTATEKKSQVHYTAVRVIAGWSMCVADAGEALGLGFDHGAEAIPAQRLLLLQVVSDEFRVVVGKVFA